MQNSEDPKPDTRTIWRLTGWDGNASNFRVDVRGETRTHAIEEVRRRYKHGEPFAGTGNLRQVMVYSCFVA